MQQALCLYTAPSSEEVAYVTAQQARHSCNSAFDTHLSAAPVPQALQAPTHVEFKARVVDQDQCSERALGTEGAFRTLTLLDNTGFGISVLALQTPHNWGSLATVSCAVADAAVRHTTLSAVQMCSTTWRMCVCTGPAEAC